MVFDVRSRSFCPKKTTIPSTITNFRAFFANGFATKSSLWGPPPSTHGCRQILQKKPALLGEAWPQKCTKSHPQVRTKMSHLGRSGAPRDNKTTKQQERQKMRACSLSPRWTAVWHRAVHRVAASQHRRASARRNRKGGPDTNAD